MSRAILLSGGMDSTALAWWKRPNIAITIDYGQRAANAELTAAKAICDALKITHVPITVDCSALGSGDMAGKSASEKAPATDWWPFRNQMLVTLAGMKCIDLGVTELIIGTVASDGTHADGRPEFFGLIDALTKQQEGELRIFAPAISLSTADLIRQSKIPANLLAWSHSCHTSDVPCGQCRGCTKYNEVYRELGYDLERA